MSIDTTDSLTPIDLSSPILVSPTGGDPTPLPHTRAADGTRKLKSLPPPIPGRASTADLIAQPRTSTAELVAPLGDGPGLAAGTATKLRAAPRASSRATLPPPIPSAARTNAESGPAIARTKSPLPAPSRAKGTVPPVPARPLTADPDGWSMSPPADDQTPLPAPDPGDDSLRDILSPDPEGPDATHATPFNEPAAAAPIDAAPSQEWLAKIDSVMRPQASAPVLFTTDGALPTTKAAAELFAAKAETPSFTEPLELVDLEPVASTPAAQPAPVATHHTPISESAPVVAAPAWPPPGFLQAAPVAPPVAAHPVAAVAASIGAAPAISLPPPRRTSAPMAVPVVQAAPYAPLTGTGSAPVVDAAPAFEQSFDIDFDADMTSAHTTNFEMPVRQSFISKRAAIALFAGVGVMLVAYLATRGGPKKPTAAPPAAEQVAKAEAPAPAPVATPAAAQVAAPVAAPAAAPADEPAPTAAPAVQNVAAATPATQEVAAPPAADSTMARLPVTSKPSGALVTFVDGGKAVVVGRTPTTISFDPRQPHDVALTLLDHETQLVTIPTGGMTALVVDMGEAKTGGAAANVPHVTPKAEPRVATDVTAMRPETPAPKHHTAPTAPAAPKAPPAQKVAAPAPHMATAEAPAGSGMLMISSKPPCEIVVDGKSTHLMTPQKAIPLAPGNHTIVLVNAQQSIHKTMGVIITAKKSTKVIQDFTKH